MTIPNLTQTQQNRQLNTKPLPPDAATIRTLIQRLRAQHGGTLRVNTWSDPAQADHERLHRQFSALEDGGRR